IWRRRAIEEAGGWQHDTLTEDTDLSYRAQLKGWKFVYLQDVECPAELPIEMTAFKTQQARWAKGLIQTGRKILPRVLKSDQPFHVKLEAWYHLTANLSYPLMVVLSVLLPPSPWLGSVDRNADRQLLRANRLLRRGERKLHHGSLSDSICNRLLVYGLDVVAARPLRRSDPQHGSSY